MLRSKFTLLLLLIAPIYLQAQFNILSNEARYTVIDFYTLGEGITVTSQGGNYQNAKKFVENHTENTIFHLVPRANLMWKEIGIDATYTYLDHLESEGVSNETILLAKAYTEYFYNKKNTTFRDAYAQKYGIGKLADIDIVDFHLYPKNLFDGKAQAHTISNIKKALENSETLSEKYKIYYTLAIADVKDKKEHTYTTLDSIYKVNSALLKPDLVYHILEGSDKFETKEAIGETMYGVNDYYKANQYIEEFLEDFDPKEVDKKAQKSLQKRLSKLLEHQQSDEILQRLKLVIHYSTIENGMFIWDRNTSEDNKISDVYTPNFIEKIKITQSKEDIFDIMIATLKQLEKEFGDDTETIDFSPERIAAAKEDLPDTSKEELITEIGRMLLAANIKKYDAFKFMATVKEMLQEEMWSVNIETWDDVTTFLEKNPLYNGKGVVTPEIKNIADVKKGISVIDVLIKKYPHFPTIKQVKMSFLIDNLDADAKNESAEIHYLFYKLLLEYVAENNIALNEKSITGINLTINEIFSQMYYRGYDDYQPRDYLTSEQKKALINILNNQENCNNCTEVQERLSKFWRM